MPKIKASKISFNYRKYKFAPLTLDKTESECKTLMDKILYSLKNGHKLMDVPRSFREKELKDIFEVARISNFDSVELAKWEASMMNKYDYRISIRDIKERCLLRTAKSMLKDGLSLARVARITKLPKEQIMGLRG